MLDEATYEGSPQPHQLVSLLLGALPRSCGWAPCPGGGMWSGDGLTSEEWRRAVEAADVAAVTAGYPPGVQVGGGGRNVTAWDGGDCSVIMIGGVRTVLVELPPMMLPPNLAGGAPGGWR